MATDNTNSEAKALASFFKINGEPSSYKKGRRLPASDTVDKILYVRSGYLTAHLVAQSSTTRARAYYTFGPGDLVQIRVLLTEARLELVYSTLTNVSLYTVPREVLWQGVYESTPIAAALVREVVRQNELHARRIENLSYRYASDKLTYRILNLAERFGVTKDGMVFINIPVTHRQLGLFINMARESVSREMQKLVTRDLINYERQHIAILNLPELIESLHESVRTDWHDLLAMGAKTRIQKK
jgi:CRP-like cAMP-binding protein